MEALAATLVEFVKSSGVWGILVAFLLTMTVAVVPFPAEVPAVLNGMLFGPWLGTGVTWAAALTGASISFELSRRWGRPLCRRWLGAEALSRADRAARAAGPAGLLAARFVPLVAFTAVNWAAGLTDLRRWTFLWTTAVGILPGAVLFTTSGAGFLALYRRRPALGLAAAALIAGVVLLAAHRRRRMGDGTHEDPGRESESVMPVEGDRDSPGPRRAGDG